LLFAISPVLPITSVAESGNKPKRPTQPLRVMARSAHSLIQTGTAGK
jgi:hypothetical protein